MPVQGWLNEEDNSDEYSPLPALIFFWEKKGKSWRVALVF